MRSHVTFIFSEKNRIEFESMIHPNDQDQDLARSWLITKWAELDCEPIRQSGKVLLLDRILGITDALGYSWMQNHPKEAQEFAQKCALALDSEVVVVDLFTLAITSS